MQIKRSIYLLSVFSLCFTGIEVYAQKTPKKTHSERKQALTPEEQLKQFKVPEGFIVELVASEENGLINPIDLAFDSSGRLWTGTARMYPIDPVGSVGKKMLEALDRGEFDDNPQFKKIRDLYQRKVKGSDQVLIIENPTQKSVGKIPVFAEGMTIPQSFIPYKNGVFVAHGSEMLFLSDKDGDGKAETQDTILTGFGFTDSHTMTHTLVRGPGGWIHFSHGALNKGQVTAVKSGKKQKINFSKIARFSIDGNDLEIINNGWNNIWGFTLKSNGQWYGTEANDLFFSHAPLHPYMGYKGIGNERIRPYQPFGGEFHKFKVGGTGISGLAYDENGTRGFPEKYKNAGFLANPITSKINLVLADRNPDGSIISKHLPDFLTCDDDWFRPVNIEFGPDGCLYIVDWYNKIVSHNEVDRSHPDRDKSHGRIWRVRHKSQTLAAIPNIAKASNSNLIKHLQAEILWEKRAAWTEIVDRNITELAPELISLANNKEASEATRIHSLWALEGLGHYDFKLMQSLTSDSNANIRREALRSLETYKPKIEEVAALTKPLINDPHYMVKDQILRTLKNVKKANTDTIEILTTFAEPQKQKSAENIHPFGGSYEKNFQSFLSFMALEEYPEELSTFLDSPAAQKMPQANLNEAAKRLPKGQRAQKILTAIDNGSAQLDASNLSSLSPSLNEPKILNALKKQLQTKTFIQTAKEAQRNLESSSLHKALTPILKQLLASSNANDQKLALQTIIDFHHPDLNTEIFTLVSKRKLQDLTPLEIKALGTSPKKNKAFFTKLTNMEETPINIKIKAALLIASIDKKSGHTALNNLLKNSKNQSLFITSLKSNFFGMRYLTEAYKTQKILPNQLSSVDKSLMLSILRKEASFFRKTVTNAKAKENKNANEQIHQLSSAYNKKGGDAVQGELFSATCIACHQIGSKGINLAPALGGYKSRDPEHLLTAIIKPNAAIEKGYELYRIVTKNGEIASGFLFNKSDFGTTIATAGGASTYFPKEQILYENLVGGQSNMPSFSALPDDVLLNLIAYLKTL